MAKRMLESSAVRTGLVLLAFGMAQTGQWSKEAQTWVSKFFAGQLVIEEDDEGIVQNDC